MVDQLNKALNQVLSDKDVIKRMEDHGADVSTSTPEQLRTLVASEGKWKGVVRRQPATSDLNRTTGTRPGPAIDTQTHPDHRQTGELHA